MRRTHHTLLLICEGYAEDHFARVVRDLYLERDCGTVLQRRNARGYGGARALELAIELRGQTEHNAYGVLVDTDRHWGSKERELARRAEITVIENDPCLEATLLAIDGQRVHGTTRDNKVAFEGLYGGPASRDGVVRRNFPRAKLDAARSRVLVLDRFLRFIRC